MDSLSVPLVGGCSRSYGRPSFPPRLCTLGGNIAPQRQKRVLPQALARFCPSSYGPLLLGIPVEDVIRSWKSKRDADHVYQETSNISM
jgi:hypothetical protein